MRRKIRLLTEAIIIFTLTLTYFTAAWASQIEEPAVSMETAQEMTSGCEDSFPDSIDSEPEEEALQEPAEGTDQDTEIPEETDTQTPEEPKEDTPEEPKEKSLQDPDTGTVTSSETDAETVSQEESENEPDDVQDPEDLFPAEDNQEFEILEPGTGTGTDPENELDVETTDIAEASISLSRKHCTYNGELRKPKVTVILNNQTLIKDKDYTISYRHNRNVGMAEVLIKGKGDYQGSETRHFRINPAGTYIQSVETGHMRASLTWKAQDTQMTGYQIRYATDSGFRSEKKITIPAGTTKKVFENLIPGKTYFLQVRTYKKVDGQNFYSGWCSVRTAKLKQNTVLVTKNQRFMTIRMINPSPDLSNIKAVVFSKKNGTDDVKRVPLARKSDGSYQADVYYNSLKHSGPCSVRCYDGDEFLNRKTVEITDGDIFLARWLFGGDSRIDYVQCAINIARNNYYGYGHTWPRTISCAGLVGLSLTYCGHGDFIKNDPLGWGYIDLGTYSGYNWRTVITREAGAVWHAGLGGLQPGDILYYDYNIYNNHTGFYIGNGLTVEARGPEGGSSNDDSGGEVAIYGSWQGLPWQGYYRLPSASINYRW